MSTMKDKQKYGLIRFTILFLIFIWRPWLSEKSAHIPRLLWRTKQKSHTNKIPFIFNRFGYIWKTQFFPIRGHYFLPCDGDFSIMKKSSRKKDRIYSITEINEIIVNSSDSKKFEVKEIKGPYISDFKNWWPKFYQKMLCLIKQIQKVYIEMKKLLFQYQNTINSVILRTKNVKSNRSHLSMDIKFRHFSSANSVKF